jgi:hypothetical protein
MTVILSRSAPSLAFTLFLASPSSGQINANASVLTQHNNPQRNGVYSYETSLTLDSLRIDPNSDTEFKVLCIRKVDARVMAQPLYVSHVTIGGQARNLLIVVTGNNTIFGFDADNVNRYAGNNAMVWPPLTLQVPDPEDFPNVPKILHAEPLSENPPPNDCGQTKGPVGILGTPVIDPASSTMYLVARFARARSDPDFGKKVYYYLFAIDIRTGQQKLNTTTGNKLERLIEAPGFQANAEFNRPGLLLMNGIIYVGFGAPVCDAHERTREQPSDRTGTHGFVLAYSAAALQYIDAYNTSPNSSLAGIWQSGAGLAGDPQRNFVFAMTGNNGDSDFIHYCQTGLGPPAQTGNNDSDYTRYCQTRGLPPPDLPGRKCNAPSDAPLDPPVDDLYHHTRTELGESILKLTLASNKFQCMNGFNGCVTEHFTAGNWYRLDTGYHGPACLTVDSALNIQQEYSPIDASRRNQCAQDFRSLPLDKRKDLTEDGACNFQGDSDLGSGGPVILSNGYVLGGGKQGRVYVLNPYDPNDPDAIRHPKQTFQAGLNTWHLNTGGKPCTLQDPTRQPNCTIVPNDDYDFFQDWGPNIHGAPVVWQPQTKDFGYVYLMAEKDFVRGYKIYKDGRVDTNANSSLSTESITVPDLALREAFGARFGPTFRAPFKLRAPDGMPGGALSLSSNGDSNAIVWVSVSPEPATYGVYRGVLMALDAANLNYLWSDPDPKISIAKFVPPTIAGGKVFRATFGDGYTDPACDPANNTDGLRSCGSIVVYGVTRKIKVKKKFP